MFFIVKVMTFMVSEVLEDYGQIFNFIKAYQYLRNIINLYKK